MFVLESLLIPCSPATFSLNRHIILSLVQNIAIQKTRSNPIFKPDRFRLKEQIHLPMLAA
jgi:hypothetical protein